MRMAGVAQIIKVNIQGREEPLALRSAGRPIQINGINNGRASGGMAAPGDLLETTTIEAASNSLAFTRTRNCGTSSRRSAGRSHSTSKSDRYTRPGWRIGEAFSGEAQYPKTGGAAPSAESERPLAPEASAGAPKPEAAGRTTALHPSVSLLPKSHCASGRTAPVPGALSVRSRTTREEAQRAIGGVLRVEI